MLVFLRFAVAFDGVLKIMCVRVNKPADEYVIKSKWLKIAVNFYSSSSSLMSKLDSWIGPCSVGFHPHDAQALFSPIHHH